MNQTLTSPTTSCCIPHGNVEKPNKETRGEGEEEKREKKEKRWEREWISLLFLVFVSQLKHFASDKLSRNSSPIQIRAPSCLFSYFSLSYLRDSLSLSLSLSLRANFDTGFQFDR